jgi:hypothetical protein
MDDFISGQGSCAIGIPAEGGRILSSSSPAGDLSARDENLEEEEGRIREGNSTGCR